MTTIDGTPSDATALTPDQAAQWERVRGRLRTEVGEAAFNSWLKPLTLQGIDDRKVAMAAPTRFMRDWVVKNYADRIRALTIFRCRRSGRVAYHGAGAGGYAFLTGADMHADWA